MYDVIVIGGGPAGLTAALYARRAGLTTLVLEGGALGGQAASTPEIENWPGSLHLSGAEFAMNLYEQVKALGAEVRFERASGLQDEGAVKRVLTPSGSWEGRTVILANGVRRRKLEVPGEERLAGRGVSYCATCDGNFFRGRETAVVGGGNTALEDALFLAKLCPKVWLIHRRDTFRGEEHLVRAVEHTGNIVPLMEHRMLSIRGAERVESVEVAGPEGVIPDNSPFSPPLELDEHGYVRSGEDCRTNVPGVFAAGDTRAKVLRQLVTAAADGASAARQAGEYLD